MTFNVSPLRSFISHAIAAAAVLLASAAFPQTFGADGVLRAVVTGPDAYLTAPTEFVATGRVDKVAADPLGRYVLISRVDSPRLPSFGVPTSPFGGVALILYDSYTGRSRTMWEQASADESNPVQGIVGDILWFPGGDTAIVPVMTSRVDPANRNKSAEPSGSLLIIHASPAMRNLTTLLQGNCIVSVPSPASGLAIVQVWDPTPAGQPALVRFVAIDSKGDILPLPEVDAHAYFFRWMSADGHTAYFVHHEQAGVPAVSPSEAQYLALDMKTRATATITEIPEQPATPTAQPKELVLSRGEFRVGIPPSKTTSQTALTTLVKPLYLSRSNDESTKTGPLDSLLVAPHADSPLLLADNSAVLYESEHTLYAVPLVRVPLSDYSQRVRERSMNNAKTIGVAMSMYAQDYDGFLPLSGAAAAMSPYIRSGDTFNDPSTGASAFRYLLNGQSQAAMKGSGTNVAGYLDSAFGRATIYADGHVTWSDLP